MPKVERYEKKACWRCRYYQIGNVDGPFCAYWKQIFPNYDAWIRGEGTKPGERVCDSWGKIEIEAAGA